MALQLSAPPLSVVDGHVRLFSHSVFLGTREEFVASLAAQTVDGRKHLVVTANLDQWIDLTHSEIMRAAYARASSIVLDGTPLVWLSRLLGAKGVHRITGADLMFDIAEAADDAGWTVAIAGGKSATARCAVENLATRYPRAKFVAVDVPYVSDAADKKLATMVKELSGIRPQIVFLCLGAPKQESLFLSWEEGLPDSVYIGAGAAVDFAGGAMRRAPSLIQAAGLEWAWRLNAEPRRLAKRYLVKSQRAIPLIWRSLRAR